MRLDYAFVAIMLATSFFTRSGASHETRPDRLRYAVFNEDGTPNLLWGEHVMEYEQTLLRPIFFEEMERMEPTWVKVHEAVGLQMDFELCIEQTADGFFLRLIQRWLEDLAEGRPRWSLRERMMG